MPFTEINKPLLLEAASIDFQFMKNGMINYRKHSKKELGLYFIKMAVEKWGNRYGYSKVTYVNNSTKVILQCKEHGDFEQTPSNHLTGYNCPKCAGNHTPSTEEFIKIARGIHQDKYDYSSVHYKSSQEKVKIICKVHGLFEQTPSNHLSGQGCPKCHLDSRRLSLEEFVQRAEEIHDNKYDYSSVNYKNSSEKVEIICPIHGIFHQTPDSHLRGGGCVQCYHDSLKLTTEEFIEKAQNLHGDKYDYSLVNYSVNKKKVTIICPIHGPFDQAPSIHLGLSGCPSCAGKNHNILYLLKCNETNWYKIGMTTDSVQKRIVSLGGNIKEIHHVKLDDTRKHESILHKLYAKEREYNLCVKNGKTEFFSLNEQQVQEVIAYMNEVSDEG